MYTPSKVILLYGISISYQLYLAELIIKRVTSIIMSSVYQMILEVLVMYVYIRRVAPKT